MTRLLGQSCGLVRAAAAPALDPAHAPVDSRSMLELLAMGAGYTRLVGWVDEHAADGEPPGGDWSGLFGNDILFLLAEIASFRPAPGGIEADRLAALANTVDQWHERARAIDLVRQAAPAWAQKLGDMILNLYAPLLAFAPGAAGRLGKIWSEPPDGPPDVPKSAQEALDKFVLGLDDVARLAAVRLGDELAGSSDHAPHAGLYAAFLQVQQVLQQDLNQFAGRHLDHYYRTVLGLRPRAAEPDRACVGVELIPRAAPLMLPAGTLLGAGKDAAGEPVEYATADDLQVSQARLKQAMTLRFTPATEGGWVDAVRATGLKVDTVLAPEGEWNPFGVPDQLDAAAGGDAVYGIVLGSPVFLLQEGRREVTVRLYADRDGLQEQRERFARAVARKYAGDPNPPGRAEVLAAGCAIHYSGAKDWRPVTGVRFEIEETEDAAGLWALKLSFTLGPEAAAWVANPALFGSQLKLDQEFERQHPHAQQWPMLRLTLAPADGNVYLYSFFAGLKLRRVAIGVQASGLSQLVLASGGAPLAAGQPFAPFGPVPDCVTELLLWHPELAVKPLSAIALNWTWKKFLPDGQDLAGYYSDYEMAYDDARFVVDARIRVNGQYRQLSGAGGVPLFGDGYGTTRFDFVQRLPAAAAMPVPEPLADGTLVFTLLGPTYAFGHQDFPRLYTDRAMENAKRLLAQESPLPTVPNPLSPMVAAVTLDYSSAAEVDLGTNAVDANAYCFHIGPFSSGAAPVDLEQLLGTDAQCEGHLYLGFEDAARDTALTLYFALNERTEAAYASDQAPLGAAADLEWRYLTAHGWRTLEGNQVSSRTDGFTRSGTVRLLVPGDFCTEHPLMPRGLFWVEARVKKLMPGRGKVRGVLMHAVEVVRAAVPPTGAAALLPAGSITAPVQRNPTVAAVVQPYPTAGGRAAEDTRAFLARVSQRLSHKQRASRPGDYERLALDLFPDLGQAKCSCANNSDGFDARVPPGEVVVTVVPRERAARSLPLPVPQHMLQDVAQGLRARAAHGVGRVVARNPAYESIKVYLAVRYRPTEDPTWSAKELQHALNRYIAPWLDDPGHALEIGCSTIEVDQLVEVALHEPYVEDVKGVAVLNRSPGRPARWFCSGESVRPHTPWTVFRPSRQHDFSDLARQPAGIGKMKVGRHFMVGVGAAPAPGDKAPAPARYVIWTGKEHA